MDALPPELLSLVYRRCNAPTRKSLFWVNRQITRGVRQAVTSCTMGFPQAIFTTSFNAFPHLTTIRVTCNPQEAGKFFGPTNFVTLAGSAVVTLSSGLVGGRIHNFRDTCWLSGPDHAKFDIASDVQASAAASVATRCLTLVFVTFQNTTANELRLPTVQNNTLQRVELEGMSCDVLDGSCIQRVTATGDIKGITFGQATSQLRELNLELRAISTLKGRYDNLTRLVIKTLHLSRLFLNTFKNLLSLALVNVEVDFRLLVNGLPMLENIVLHNSRPILQSPAAFVVQCHDHPRLDFLEIMLDGCFEEDYIAWSETVNIVTRFRSKTAILSTCLYVHLFV